MTAYNAPHPIFAKLAERYPDITIRHEWVDEDIGSNCGRYTYENGEHTEEYIPDGLFCYHLRERDDGNGFATLEKRVSVNHSGSVITAEEIDFGGQDHIAQRYEAGKQYAEFFISNYDTSMRHKAFRQFSLFDLETERMEDENSD